MTKDRMIGIRVSEDQRTRLKARAAERNMNLTDYLIATALGEMEARPAGERFEEIEARLARVEKALYED